MELKDAVNNFISSLKLRTDSSETIRGYSNMLKNDYIPFMENKFNGSVVVDQITIVEVESYLIYRKDIRGDANISVNRSLYILRSLYKHMASRNLIEKNFLLEIAPLKVKQKERDTLTLDEIDELLEAIDHELIWLAVKTLSYTGLRVSELCNLELNDVDLDKKMIYVIDGKGGKDRKVPIAQSLVPDLKKYIDFDRPNFVNSNNFFALEKTGGLSPQYLNKVLKDAVNKLGWDKHITAHNLRHSMATNLVRRGANIKEVGKILGHTDIRTTSVYLHSNDKEITDAIGLLD